MRKVRLAIVIVVAFLVLFTFVPMVSMRSETGNHAGGVIGHATVSPSFYLLGCGIVFNWVQTSLYPFSHATTNTFATWLCKGNNYVWR